MLLRIQHWFILMDNRRIIFRGCFFMAFLTIVLLVVADDICMSLDSGTKQELDSLISSKEYSEALEYANQLLDEDDTDPDLWDYIAQLTTDTFIDETYDPHTGFPAYEELYLSLDLDDESQLARFDELPEEITSRWSDAILDLTMDLSYSPATDYKKFAGKTVPVFLHFEADWCGWCRKMMDSVESFDTEFMDRVLVIRYDMDLGKGSLPKQYGVNGIPHNVFIDRKGNEAQFIGYMKRRKIFAAYLAITDFFYEDNLEENETLKSYILRIYSKIRSKSDDEIDVIMKNQYDEVYKLLYE